MPESVSAKPNPAYPQLLTELLDIAAGVSHRQTIAIGAREYKIKLVLDKEAIEYLSTFQADWHYPLFVAFAFDDDNHVVHVYIRSFKSKGFVKSKACVK